MEKCSAYTAKGERCQLPAVLAVLSFSADVTGIPGYFGVQPKPFQQQQATAAPTSSLTFTITPDHASTVTRAVYPHTDMTGPILDGTPVRNDIHTPEPSKTQTSVQCTEPQAENSSLSVTSTATVGTVVEISIKVVQTPCTQVTQLIIDGNIAFESEKAEFT